ncbi:MAG TPA: hypothetical protein VN494_06475, partial [Patescibacteria group bacterium]|nr:hypothetical protein [Patescibacteria group bacterium]
AGDSKKTIGPVLQEARTAKGLTIEAAACRRQRGFPLLRPTDGVGVVPPGSRFIRFLTEYATFFGLDPKQLEVQLKEQVHSARVSHLSYSMPSICSGIDLRRMLTYLLPAAATGRGRPPAR